MPVTGKGQGALMGCSLGAAEADLLYWL